MMLPPPPSFSPHPLPFSRGASLAGEGSFPAAVRFTSLARETGEGPRVREKAPSSLALLTHLLPCTKNNGAAYRTYYT